jgi:hypothetical protein
LAYGLYSGSPTSTVIQLVNSCVFQ